MNYRHAYHAGNFADVLKHAVLVWVVRYLQQKPGPICLIDSHGGAGLYDLGSEAARKTGEAASGVSRLHGGDLPGPMAPYLDLVRQANSGGTAALYPGSPWLMAQMLRERDRAVIGELHPADAAALRDSLRGRERVRVVEGDGYALTLRSVPPAEKRGLVLIDPPFEAQAGEFLQIEGALAAALARWPNATYAVWYPIKLRQHIVPFHRCIAERSGASSSLVAELLLHPDNSALRLNGCGMAIVNPPWKFDRQLDELLPVLRELLAQSRYGAQKLEWLKAA
jgi:23S rRNA (adenine2030-N6)-methyltransferase